jgi:hypothetical protein
MLPSIAALALLMAILSSTCGALRTYKNTAPLVPNTAQLSWTITADTAKLALVITDNSTVKSSASALWLGIGIGDPHAGGMIGADIVTAEFGPTTSPTNCSLVDRHVPSVSYPLDSAKGGDAVFPAPDTCGQSSWTLVGCVVDTVKGTITLEVDRPLVPGNAAEDREIRKGKNIMMAAWGDGFTYHSSKRKSISVDLEKNGPQAVGGQSMKEAGLIPKDATGSQLLSIRGYQIPASDTTYACAGFYIDVPAKEAPRQIIAAEPVIDLSTPAGKMVHHFVLSSCLKDKVGRQHL